MKRTRFSQDAGIQEMYAPSAYLVINKKLLQKYKPNIAVFLSNLIDKRHYFSENGMLIDGKWFYLVHEQQMEQTGLTLAKIQHYKKVLKEDGVLETELRGLPAKEYYAIDFNKLSAIVQGNSPQTSTLTEDMEEEEIEESPPPISPREKQDQSHFENRGQSHFENRGHYKVKENIEKENKENIKKKVNQKRKSIPPYLDDVAEYCKQRRNNIDPNKFHDFYSSKNWMVGKNKMVDWQAAVRTWEKSNGNGNGGNIPKKQKIIQDGRTWFLSNDGRYRDANGVRLD